MKTKTEEGYKVVTIGGQLMLTNTVATRSNGTITFYWNIDDKKPDDIIYSNEED